MLRLPDYVSREDALLDVGAGWAGLINRAYDLLENYPTLKVVQVKEKFGGLRIYTDGYIEEFEKVLRDLEYESFNVCETCGNPGKLRSGGWYKTLCEEHSNGREAVEPF